MKDLRLLLFLTIFVVMVCYFGVGLPATNEAEVSVAETQSPVTELPYEKANYIPLSEMKTKPKGTVSEEEINLLARLAMAEAESESEYGQRLVIDTVLNRMLSPYFPDTVEEVIFQPYHYSSVWNGRLDKCSATDTLCRYVREELGVRQSTEVIFYRTERYSDYGVPLFQEGAHYFSKYE